MNASKLSQTKKEKKNGNFFCSKKYSVDYVTQINNENSRFNPTPSSRNIIENKRKTRLIKKSKAESFNFI